MLESFSQHFEVLVSVNKFFKESYDGNYDDNGGKLPKFRILTDHYKIGEHTRC